MKIFVAINMWEGLVEDVRAFKTKPKNIKPLDEHADNGHLIYELEVEDNENENLWSKSICT